MDRQSTGRAWACGEASEMCVPTGTAVSWQQASAPTAGVDTDSSRTTTSSTSRGGGGSGSVGGGSTFFHTLYPDHELQQRARREAVGYNNRGSSKHRDKKLRTTHGPRPHQVTFGSSPVILQAIQGRKISCPRLPSSNAKQQSTSVIVSARGHGR